MNTERILITITVSALCTFFLRALPFLAFSGAQKMPDWLDRLGKHVVVQGGTDRLLLKRYRK